jgi:hypothetical protein
LTRYKRMERAPTTINATARSQMELRRNLADDQKAVSTNTQPTRQSTHRRRLCFVPGRLELAIVSTLVRLRWAPEEAAS